MQSINSISPLNNLHCHTDSAPSLRDFEEHGIFLDKSMETMSREELQLWVAVLQKNSLKVHTLLNDGTPVNTLDDNHFCPLQLAIVLNDPQTMKVLLQNGADPNRRNKTRNFFPLKSALMYPDKNQFELVQLLIEYNADMYAIDEDGDNLLACAILCESPIDMKVIDYFLEHGVDPGLTNFDGLSCVAHLISIEIHDEHEAKHCRIIFEKCIKKNRNLYKHLVNGLTLLEYASTLKNCGTLIIDFLLDTDENPYPFRTFETINSLLKKSSFSLQKKADQLFKKYIINNKTLQVSLLLQSDVIKKIDITKYLPSIANDGNGCMHKLFFAYFADITERGVNCLHTLFGSSKKLFDSIALEKEQNAILSKIPKPTYGAKNSNWHAGKFQKIDTEDLLSFRRAKNASIVKQYLFCLKLIECCAKHGSVIEESDATQLIDNIYTMHTFIADTDNKISGLMEDFLNTLSQNGDHICSYLLAYGHSKFFTKFFTWIKEKKEERLLIQNISKLVITEKKL